MRAYTFFLCLFSLLVFGANHPAAAANTGLSGSVHQVLLSKKSKALAAAQEYADLEESQLEEQHFDGPLPQPQPSAQLCEYRVAQQWFLAAAQQLLADVKPKASRNFPPVRIHHTPIYLTHRVLRI